MQGEMISGLLPNPTLQPTRESGLHFFQSSVARATELYRYADKHA
jgi:hypothetical protein